MDRERLERSIAAFRSAAHTSNEHARYAAKRFIEETERLTDTIERAELDTDAFESLFAQGAYFFEETLIRAAEADYGNITANQSAAELSTVLKDEVDRIVSLHPGNPKAELLSDLAAVASARAAFVPIISQATDRAVDAVPREAQDARVLGPIQEFYETAEQVLGAAYGPIREGRTALYRPQLREAVTRARSRLEKYDELRQPLTQLRSLESRL